MPPKALPEEKQGRARQQIARVPEEDEIVESVETGEISNPKIKESNKELYKAFMKDSVHDFPLELVHSEEEEEESEKYGVVKVEKRKREEDEAEERVVKRLKKEKKGLWEGFGEKGEFELRSGLLYDPKRWIEEDF